jgi:hypothetical protein
MVLGCRLRYRLDSPALRRRPLANLFCSLGAFLRLTRSDQPDGGNDLGAIVVQAMEEAKQAKESSAASSSSNSNTAWLSAVHALPAQ